MEGEWSQVVYRKSLYFPSNFAMSLKLDFWFFFPAVPHGLWDLSSPTSD